MKKVFFIANLWYVMAIIAKHSFVMTPAIAKMVGVLIVLNLLYYVTATMLWLVGKGAATHVDNTYMKINMACIISRLTTMAVAVIGITDIGYVVLFNCFSIFIIYFWLNKYKFGFSDYEIGNILNGK